MAGATFPAFAAGSGLSVSPAASAAPLPGADEAALRSLLLHASTSSDDAAEEDHPAAVAALMDAPAGAGMEGDAYLNGDPGAMGAGFDAGVPFDDREVRKIQETVFFTPTRSENVRGTRTRAASATC